MRIAQFSHFLLQEKAWICKAILLCCIFCRKRLSFISLVVFLLPFICEQVFTIPVQLFAVTYYINSCWITFFTKESVKLHRFENRGQIIPMFLFPTWSLPAVVCALQRKKWSPAWERKRLAKVNKKCRLVIYIFSICILETSTSHWQLLQLSDEYKRSSTQILKPDPWEPYENREFDWQSVSP